MKSILIALVLLPVLGYPDNMPCGEAQAWRRYQGCRLVDHPSNDGDSFRVRHRGTIYVFRLYFVDAPETDKRFPERLEAQARYWGVTVPRVMSVGREATRFAREFMQGDFEVFTRHEDALGSGAAKRYFAMVRKDGRFLCEALVEAGLARIFGMPSDLPDGRPAAAWWGHLYRTERSARAAGAGGWRTE